MSGSVDVMWFRNSLVNHMAAAMTGMKARVSLALLFNVGDFANIKVVVAQIITNKIAVAIVV